MGNFYTGKLKMDIDPKKISLEDLVNILKANYNDNVSYQISFIDCDENKDTITDDEYDVMFMCSENYIIPDKKLEDDPDLEDFDDILTNENIEEISKFSDKLYNYYIVINVCTKQYIFNNVEKSLQDLISELVPYRLKFAVVKDNVIGTVQDEDLTYRKQFVWDAEQMKKDMEDRKPICGGCNVKGYPNYDYDEIYCIHYDKCKRAYDLGRNSVSKSEA